jgi:hypothetical protein
MCSVGHISDATISLTQVVAWFLYVVLLLSIEPTTTRAVCMSDRGNPEQTRDRREEGRKTDTGAAALSDKRAEIAASASERVAAHLAAILRRNRR